jgi:hypothetical protein
MREWLNAWAHEMHRTHHQRCLRGFAHDGAVAHGAAQALRDRLPVPPESITPPDSQGTRTACAGIQTLGGARRRLTGDWERSVHGSGAAVLERGDGAVVGYYADHSNAE